MNPTERTPSVFTPFDHEDSDLTEAIASAHSDLKAFSADEEGYQKAVDQLSKLYALQNNLAQLNLQAQQSFAAHQLALDESRYAEEQNERPFYERVDPNTVVTVAGNLLVALIVIKYEQKSVIATKVMSFMRKF
jgi:hypothetical protein